MGHYIDDPLTDNGPPKLIKNLVSAQEAMHGYLRTYKDANGDVLIGFFNTMDFGDFAATQKMTLNRVADGSSGTGSIYTPAMNFGPEGGAGDLEFNIAFNDNYFLREDADGNKNCTDRENFISNAWRYNIYDETGGRVTVNSGFPIKFIQDDEFFHGYIGYHGLWFPDGLSLETGDTVYRQEYGPQGDSEGTPYTAFIAGGKLVRHTRQSITLGELAGVPLQWSNCSENGCQQFRVKWDKTEQKLYKTAYMDEAKWLWHDITPVEVTFSEWDWNFNFWSESLRGNGYVRLFDQQGDPLTFNNDTEATFHSNATVFPGDENVPTSLACFNECLDGDAAYLTGSMWDAGESSFNFTSQNLNAAQLVADVNYAAYTFDPATMLLTYNGTGVVTTESEQEWGYMTGALIDPADFTQLGCDWNENGTCPWKSFEVLDEYYTWETGPNSWNHLAILKDANGEFQSFDPPLMVEYTHSTGTKYYLEYNGMGDLWGIPGKCIDADTGLDVDCSKGGEEGNFIRWVPEFSLSEGSLVTHVESNVNYYVKPLEVEQQMISVDPAICTAAGLTLTDYELPDGSEYAVPDIGTQPTIETGPAVIGGDLVSEINPLPSP